MRMVMQDAVRTVFEEWPEVRIEVFVVYKKLNVQATTAE